MKKVLSIFILVTMLVSSIPVLATDNSEKIIEDVAPTPIVMNETYYDVDDNISDDENEKTDEDHTINEYINEDITLSDETFNLMAGNLPEPGDINLFSTTNDFDSVWNELFSEQFGDDYLKPYEKNTNSQRITGNTNRLLIEENDLKLNGKNGLNFNLIRKHDNQDYNEFTSAILDGQNAYRHRYMVALKNTSTNKRIYVAFYTEDDFYTYLYNGCHMKDISKLKSLSITRNDSTYEYYLFSSINSYITDDETEDYYEYDKSFTPIEFNIAESDTTRLISRRVLANRDCIGQDWTFLFPEVYLYQYSCDVQDNCTDKEVGSKYKLYSGEYVGAFRDLDGTVYSLTGYDAYRKYKSTINSKYEYTSSFRCQDNKNLSFSKMFHTQSLSDGTQYNFTVEDKTGRTYYLYNPSAKDTENPKVKQPISIVAIKDKYGNMIHYYYDENYVRVKKIVDTYGREININYTTNKTVVSYIDDITGETKNITYDLSTLNSSALDNDSPIKPKEVQRLTVTNQLGEKTIYDSRKTQVVNIVSSEKANITQYPRMDTLTGAERIEGQELSQASNVERIIYPTGAETRFKYKMLYVNSPETKVTRGVYGVESSYDLLDGKEINKKEYSFTNSGQEITVTSLNYDTDCKTVSNYNKDGLIKNKKINSIKNYNPYYEEQYSYDDNGKPTQTVVNNNGLSSYKEFEYQSSYPDRLTKEVDGRREVDYTYHDETGAMATAEYKYKTGDYYTEDYVVSTELTEDKKAVAYERTTKGSVIQSQVKYEYDDEGNVIAAKQWTSDSNNDGVLDENDEYITTTSSYETTADKTKKVINKVEDVENVDGQNEGDVTSEYKLNIFGSPLYKKDSYGTETTIEYDSMNRPIKYNLANGGTKTVEYITNNNDNYTIVTDETGVRYKNVYDGLGRITSKARSNNGRVWVILETYKYDNASRLIEKVYGQSGAEKVKETYTYDNLNQLKSKSLYEDTSKLLYTENYSYKDGITTKETVAADNTDTSTLKTYSNGYGEIIKTENISGDTTITNQFEYDYQGRKIKETDANNNSNTYEYDCKGQLIKSTNALNQSVTTQYDLAGQVVSSTDLNGNTTVVTYDKLGRAIQSVSPFDSRNAVTKTYYDKNSNVVKKSVKKDENTYQSEEYKYDNMGNLVASISGENLETAVVQYQYDTANRMTKMITGLSQYSENPTTGNVTVYSYNENGFLEKTTDPMGNTEYNELFDIYGNILAKTDKNDKTLFYTYGAYGVTSEDTREDVKKEVTYNSLGQQVKTSSTNADDSVVEENYTYDAFGRLTSKTSNDGTIQNYTYDNSSNLLSYDMIKDDQTKNSITYSYNKLNRLTQLTNNDNIYMYQYDKNGNLTTVFDSTNVNFDLRISYNKANLPTLYNPDFGGKEYEYQMTYDLLGQKKTEKDVLNKIDKEYFYTSLGQLSMEERTENNMSVSTDYQYDKAGNRIQMNEYVQKTNAHNVTDYTYDANNRMTSTTTTANGDVTGTTRYYYDNNGNTIAEQRKNYTSGNEQSDMSLSGRIGTSTAKIYKYDAFNRLVRFNEGATEATYTYGADNLRNSKTVNNIRTDFVWNGQNLASETKNDITTTYTYDPTGIVMSNDGTDTVRFIKDPHGNVVATSKNDKIVDSYDYTAFGVQLNSAETSNQFRYCGEYYDEELDSVYLRNRYYQPASGRFINEDPIKDGLNWYSYCGGNPVMMVDPSGLDFGFDDEEYANSMLQHINEMTGGKNSEGYYKEKIEVMDDDTIKHIYLIKRKTDYTFNGGSAVARAVINAAIDDKEHLILVQHQEDLEPGASSTVANENGELITLSDKISEEEIKYALIHETTHAMTDILGINNRVIVNEISDNKSIVAFLKETMYKKYKEALAITIENAVRRDLKYKQRVGETGIGVNCYGTFPIDFTTNQDVKVFLGNDIDGKPIYFSNVYNYIYANTLKSYGNGIEEYFLANFKH
mgnify:CR=1 FL=1